MLLKSLRWIFGYVSFEAIGESPEKLINLSVKNSIGLWDLKKVNKSLYGNIMLPEYENFTQIAKKCNCEINPIKKTGFPFVKLRYSKRWGALIGIIIFAAIIWISSLYVWSINVSGNNEISSEDIINTAKDCGVCPGILKKRIDVSSAEQMIMSKLGNIAWMSVNIEGSCVNIIVKEKIVSPEIVGESEPCNIIASKDGQIERLETYKGTPVVSAGDIVTKGQLLVSGVVEGPDFKSGLTDADCKVFAKTKHKVERKIPLTTVQAKDTGKIVKKYRIKAFGKEFSIWSPKKIDDTYRCENSSNNAKFFGVDIPIVLYTEKWYEQECSEKTITSEEAKKEIVEELSKIQDENNQDIKILEKFEEEREENGEYIYNAIFSCIENIGKREKIEIE